MLKVIDATYIENVDYNALVAHDYSPTYCYHCCIDSFIFTKANHSLSECSYCTFNIKT